MGGGGAVQRGLDDARPHARGARRRVDVEDAVELEAVHGDARPDRLARAAARGAAGYDGDAVARGDLHHRVEVLDGPGHQDDVGHHPVARGVGRVEPAPQRGLVHLAGDHGPQGGRGGTRLTGRLGDAVAGAHGAKDTAQRPPGLNAGSQRPSCSSTPSIMSTPKTTRRIPEATWIWR